MSSIKELQTALAGLHVHEAKPVPLLQQFLANVIAPFVLCDLGELVSEPEIFEARAEVLRKEFDKHPDWQEPFRKLVKSSRQSQDDYSLQEALRIFGNRSARLWLLASKMGKSLKLKEITPDLETGRLPLDVNQSLKYAISAQAKFGEDSRYKDVTFAAGLILDFLTHLHHSSWVNMGGKKYDEFINTSFNHCVEAGALGIEICRFQKKATLEKWVPAYPLLWFAGRLCMMILFPGYMDFVKKADKENIPPPVLAWREKEVFGVPAAAFSQLLAELHPVFDKLGDALVLHGHPYCAWVSKHKDIHDLAAISSLALWLKSPGGKSVADGMTAGAIRPELSDLDYIHKSAKLKKG